MLGPILAAVVIVALAVILGIAVHPLFFFLIVLLILLLFFR